MAADDSPVQYTRGRQRVFVWTGLLVGLVAFVLVGMMPSLVWGGVIGIGLARALLGHLVGGEALTSVLALLGMAIGATFAIALFAGAGTWLGAASYRALDATDRPGGRLFGRARK
jgi:hypothetical protein